MKTLVLGLGNTILTDDGVGIHVVRAAEARYKSRTVHNDADVTFIEASVGGLRLIETIAGYERLILVDAIQTRGGIPGQIHRLQPGNLNASLHAGSSHDLTFTGALALGRRLGMAIPEDEDIHIVAIEAEDVLTFGETCTPAVAAAIPQAADRVLAELD
jgi:hydrogenase maturation protease